MLLPDTTADPATPDLQAAARIPGILSLSSNRQQLTIQGKLHMTPIVWATPDTCRTTAAAHPVSNELYFLLFLDQLESMDTVGRRFHNNRRLFINSRLPRSMEIQ